LADPAVAERLLKLRESLRKTQKGMSDLLDLGESTWQRLELKGHIPRGDTLQRLIELGFNTNWILAGQGPMRAGDQQPDGAGEQPSPIVPADPALSARIAAAIDIVYREERVELAPINLAALAIDKYQKIRALSADPDDWPGMIKMMAADLRAELRAAAASPATSKRQA
jgi:transcriptional regulator with XRE-family HTH domain